MQYSLESIDLIFEEIFPLLKEHFLEVSANLDIELSPNRATYCALERNGAFKIFTARNNQSEILGYAAYFINHSLHYQTSLQAVQDVVFIRKDARGFGKDFINWCDEQLKILGVQVVYHHVKVKHDWGHMLEKSGYDFIEKIYSKRLDQ